MNQISIKEKILSTGMLILSREYLEKILQVSWKKYKIDTLVRFKYIAVVKKWESYYNLLIKDFKNPYMLWAAYMWETSYMFLGLDRYNKEWFTTQISNIYTIYNTKYSRKIQIVWVSFVFKKVKPDFIYAAKKYNNISYMERERLFLEYVRDYMKYDDDFFIPLLDNLDIKVLKKYAKKYPIRKVAKKITKLVCI